MSEPRQKREDFTKGEKCIFFHIVATFSLILVLLIIFFIHLCLVKHSAHDVMRVFRRSDYGDAEETSGTTDYYSRVGVVFLTRQSRVLCSALLLKPEWSLVPGHCASTRSEPDLAAYLPDWRIRYAKGPSDIETAVRKSVPHPQFDSEYFINNVGVLQHEIRIPTEDFVYPNAMDESLELVGWDWDEESYNNEERFKRLFVYSLPTEECQHFVASIAEVRSPYEFCVIAAERSKMCFEHGALVYSRNTVVGFFSWGERCGKVAVPLVVVNIKMYQPWLEDITSMSNDN